MADDHDGPDDQWGNKLAHMTFIWTLILAAMYCGVVFIFILR